MKGKSYCSVRTVSFLIIFAIFGIFAFYGFNNLAQAAIGLNIQPIKVSHTIKPSESAFGKIQITNAGDEAVSVESKVEDFVPMAGTINIQFVGRAPGVTTVRDWITLEPAKSFILQKGEAKEIVYTINAPSNAEPGGHFGVAFFKATQLANKVGEQLNIGTQVGMLIFVTIPGNNLQKGQILDFSAPNFIQKGPVDFKIKFENTGTVHFEPKGEIKIFNIFGKEVANLLVEGQVVLPSGVRDLVISWKSANFLLGRYRAQLSLKDGEGNVLTAKSIAFYAIPIWYVLGFLASVAILFFGLKFLKKRLKISVSFEKKPPSSNS